MDQTDARMSHESQYPFPKVHETPWRPFPNRPTDESVYRYPHEYKVQFRTHERFSQQRHVWRWDGDGGKLEVEQWIRTLSSPQEIEALPVG